MPTTDRDLRDQITTALAEFATDYDIDAILTDIQDQYGTVDIDTIEPDAFWAIVARHDTTSTQA